MQSIFGGQDNDAIVSVGSQDAGLDPPAGTVLGVIHSQGVTSLGFSEPDEMSSSQFSDVVIGLLNLRRAGDQSFVLLP